MSDDTTASATTSAAVSKAAADGGLRDRRTVLRCAAMVALAGAGAPLLAACGGSDNASGGSTGSTGSGTSPSATASSSAPASSGTPSAGGGGGGGGTVIGPVSDVPVGGGKVFADAKVVVTQPTAGTYKGFSAVCTHQGNPIGSVEGGQIVCPFHNSHFSIKDGSVVSGPAPTALPAVNVKVVGGNIVESA
ncbi:Rieske (2Fe-2S) protein [Kribbella sp. NPDC004536]|uniref:Rieske (2Fe-2S) protein n=1 Tax=Kribbella sp. NPDC004536 TaxID=3364106 RepID=UPI003678EFB8